MRKEENNNKKKKNKGEGPERGKKMKEKKVYLIQKKIFSLKYIYKYN